MSTEVDKVTTALAGASISTPAAESPSTIAAAEGRRLYIGNLAYTTTEANLKDFFKDYKVESVSIPVNPRTSRAVGYAFVDVVTKEEADKAIDDLSGKEILERKVSVQVARKPGTGPAQTNGDAPRTEDGPRRGGRGGARGSGRGGRGGRFSRRRGDSTRAAGEAPAAVAASNAASGAAAPAAAATTTSTTAEPAKTEATDKAADGTPRPPRRKRGPPENGVASKTKVMVANLPYELTEAALKDIFKAYDPESAKIALRPIPRFMVRKLQARGEARKGRGFGFVTLPTEELQKKAVDEMNGKVIEGREIAVKVAIDNPKDDEDDEEGGEETAEGAKVDGAAAEPAVAAAPTDAPAAKA